MLQEDSDLPELAKPALAGAGISRLEQFTEEKGLASMSTLE